MPSNGTEMATNASGAPASEVILPEIVLWAVRVGAPMASPPRVNNSERIQRFMSPPHVAPGDAFEMATRNRAGEDSGCGDVEPGPQECIQCPIHWIQYAIPEGPFACHTTSFGIARGHSRSTADTAREVIGEGSAAA